MTATTAKSAAPPWSVVAWTDDLRIYIELPGANGPVVLAYPRDAKGFADALGVLRKQKANLTPAASLDAAGKPLPSGYVAQATPPTRGKKSADFTDAQRAETAKLLKKLGLT